MIVKKCLNRSNKCLILHLATPFFEEYEETKFNEDTIGCHELLELVRQISMSIVITKNIYGYTKICFDFFSKSLKYGKHF